MGLVADGARARVLLNAGAGTGLAPALPFMLAATHGPTREIGAERPGRVQGSAHDGTRHSITPRVDFHQHERTIFAREVVRVLNEASHRREFDRLVLILPPKSLGEVRAGLTKETAAKVVAEHAKDLTHLSIHDLAQHLAPPLHPAAAGPGRALTATGAVRS